MPVFLNQNGTPVEYDVFVNQGGVAVPCEVYQNNGGTPEVIYLPIEIIDDFEDGNRAGWNVASSTGSDTIISPGLNGSSNAWRQNGLIEAHLPGTGAIDRGPAPGDRFEFWFRIDSTSGEVINRFHFSADGNNDGDCYRFEFERQDTDTGNEYQLVKLSGGSIVKTSQDLGAAKIGQPYRVQIDWNRGNSNITAQVFRPNGTTVTTPITITDNSSNSGTEYTQPGIATRTNANNTCTWDGFQITES